MLIGFSEFYLLSEFMPQSLPVKQAAKEVDAMSCHLWLYDACMP